jgi:hypothetical protein
LPVVSARPGHSSVHTTPEIYAHMVAGQDEAAAKAYERPRCDHSVTLTPLFLVALTGIEGATHQFSPVQHGLSL